MLKRSGGVVRRMKLAAAMLALAALIVGFVATGPAADAANPSWTHNQYYGYSALKDQPYVSRGYVRANLYNDTQVQMICWLDSEWVTSRSYSNYNSPRWFLVRTPSGAVGYIHSSYVYYQQPVGHC